MKRPRGIEIRYPGGGAAVQYVGFSVSLLLNCGSKCESGLAAAKQLQVSGDLSCSCSITEAFEPELLSELL